MSKITRQELSTEVKQELDEISLLSGRVTTIENELATADLITVTVQQGTSVINATNSGKWTPDKIEGRTLVNLLGRDGNCESLTPFTITGIAPALSTAQKKSGTNSIKLTLANQSTLMHKDYDYTLDKTKRYVFGLWVFIESYTSGSLQFRLYDKGAFANIRYSFVADTSKVGVWQFIYTKIPADNIFVGSGFRLGFGAFSNVMYTAYIDEMRIYELSQADYDAIGNAYVTDEQIDKFIPYVDDIKSIFHPYVIHEGKNLLPPFSKWTVHANTVIDSTYKATLNATASGQNIEVRIKVAPNTQYTWNAVADDYSGSCFIYEYDARNTLVVTRQLLNASGLTFTTGANTVELLVRFRSNEAKVYTFENPMLNLGSTVLPFEPQNRTYHFIETELRSNVGGMVKDTQYFDEQGQARVNRRVGYMVLDGSLGWQYAGDNPGFKRVRITGFTGLNGTQIAVKNDGKIIPPTSTWSAPDQSFIDEANDHFIISISDTESGWDDAWTGSNLTTELIKAYFNGWKYTGTADKVTLSWVSVYTGAAAPTQTLEYVSNNKAPGWTEETAYKLQYQLAQSVDEAVPHEGTITLHEGLNQLTMGAGVIVREAANPVLNNGFYKLNYNNVSAHLDFRTEKILTIYKDTNDDTGKWVITTSVDLPNGNSVAYIPQANYDPTAAYSTTYLALDLYKLGFAPQSIAGTYEGNLAEVVNQHTEQLADVETRVDVIENTFARKQQGQWIVPTLLNGWVALDSSRTPKYFKDEFGIVHLKGAVMSGTVPGDLFYLPVGYRTVSTSHGFPVISSNGSAILGFVTVESSGKVRIQSPSGNTLVYLDGISFRAEQ